MSNDEKCPLWHNYSEENNWCLVLCKYGVDVVPVANQTEVCRGMTNLECEAVAGKGATWWGRCYDSAGPPVDHSTNLTVTAMGEPTLGGGDVYVVYLGLAAFVLLCLIVFLSTGKKASRNKKILAVCIAFTLIGFFGVGFFLSLSLSAFTGATGVAALLGVPLVLGGVWYLYKKSSKDARLKKKIRNEVEKGAEEQQQQQQQQPAQPPQLPYTSTYPQPQYGVPVNPLIDYPLPPTK